MELRYYKVWLESDSLQLVRAFNQNVTVPWQVSNRWNNCKNLVKGFHFICTHTPREGNQVADALAKNGHSLTCFTSQWWNDPPSFLGVLLNRYSTRLPSSKLHYNVNSLYSVQAAPVFYSSAFIKKNKKISG